MISILKNRAYRHLFAAQVIALIGTGLATVALGLLAFEIAGADAGTVLGTALAIKMIAYVGLAPLAQALAERVPRRALLVSLDLVRAVIALLLPFVSEVWQIYVLIFLLQAASAGFTPAFQATIPDILTDEPSYTRALSLSRLAYDLESLLSPMLAAALLSVVSFPALFGGTVIGFLASALLVLSVRLPRVTASEAVKAQPFARRVTHGVRLYLATPRLRGLLAVNLAVAAAGAMVIVNSVVIVQGRFGLTEQQTALALAFFGGGSMLAALALPSLLEKLGDRPVMITSSFLLALVLLASYGIESYMPLLIAWAVLGVGYAAAQTPAGRLIRRSSHEGDRPALFAAQFALSHLAWLITYPLAGWLGARLGMAPTFLVMAGLAVASGLLALWLWRAGDEAALAHDHPELSADDPHFEVGERLNAQSHRHEVIIDELHPHWPRGG